MERSRKASLHAASPLFTQKTKFFLHIFTKSPKPCLWSRFISFCLWRGQLRCPWSCRLSAGGCVTFHSAPAVLKKAFSASLQIWSTPLTLRMIFSLFLFRVQDLVPRSDWSGTGLDFQRFTHLLCKSSNFQQSYKFPDKSSQIVMIDKLLMQQLRQKSASISCKCLQTMIYFSCVK